MQEFSSISVSSYDAGSLADKLTEQSRDGWSVVGIVQTGSSVTAYLSRDADAGSSTDAGGAAESAAVPAAASLASDTSRHEPDVGEDELAASAGDEITVDGTAGDEQPTDEQRAEEQRAEEQPTEDHAEPASTDDTGAHEPAEPEPILASGAGHEEPVVDPVDEAPGWGAGSMGAESGSIEEAAAALPEVAAASSTDVGSSGNGSASGAGTDGGGTSTDHLLPESASDAGSTDSTESSAGAATAADAGATAATAEAATAETASAAPAGWYADPSSRFELRYWDGSQWTEHVSRAGQQYTDPPIA